MGKPTLTDTKNSKAGFHVRKKLARNNGPGDEEKGAAQQSITSFFGTGRCQLWTIVDSDSKGKKKNLKLSTQKDSQSKNESQYFIKRKGIQSKSSNFCKPAEVFYYCEQNGFTKILQPRPAKTLSPSDERNDVPCDRISCHILNNNGVIADEDEDLIPPTPSPVGRHSFLNCQVQQSCVDSSCSLTHTSKDVHRNTDNAKVRCSTRLVKNGNTVLEDTVAVLGNALNMSKDSKRLYSLASPDGEATVRMSRKRYKITRKGKTSRVVSSPLKLQYDHGPTKRSPYRHKEGDRETLGQTDSSVVVAPSKCFVSKSRMKRSAAKGSSPSQKRQQTELPAVAKNMAKCDLQKRLDGLHSNQTKVHLGCPSIKLDQCSLEEDVVDAKVIESYVNVLTSDEFDKDFYDNINASFARVGTDSQCAENNVLDVVKLPINGSYCVSKEQRKHREECIKNTYLLEKEMQIRELVKSPVKPSLVLPNAKQVYNGFQSPLKSSNLQTSGELNISKDSLAEAAEVESLLEGLVWSPIADSSDKLNISSQNTARKALFSSPKAESQIESPNVLPRDDSSSTSMAFSSSTSGINYSRFLVLEVSRRESVDHQVVARYGRQLSEKVLRLFDGAQSQEWFCCLREDWEMTEVEPGDIVHISGTFDVDTEMWILDNSTNAYIVVHPDTLISGTTVSMATKCLRRSILNERCRTESQSEAMLIGTLLHDIFDVAMEYNEFSLETIMSKATVILQKVSYLNDLYSLGKTESWALEKVNEYIPQFSEWARKFVVPFPHPDLGIMDFKTPENPQSKEEPSVCVSGLKDIEENIWSPRLGLKGKVDATVEVKIDRRQRIRRHRPDTGDQVKTQVIPLELKTGKMFSKLGSIEHRAQVILYTLLMSERQSQAVDSGLLFYMKTGHMVGVPAFLHEKRALVMKRNEVARFMTLNRAGATCAMPAMLRDLNTCGRCSQAQNCTVFHKAVEEGDDGSSGLGTFFDEMTVHMTSSYTKYFAEWFKLLCLEAKELEEKTNQWEIWCIGSWEREKMGRCFSRMELVDSAFVNGGFFRHKFVRCEEHPSVTPLQDVPITCGDRIIVSQDPAGAVALTAGVIHEITKKDVIVLLDRDLAKRYNGRTDRASSKLYRLDKGAEYNILTTAWSNTVKLFRGDSDRDAELRRQIVDLEPPVFSRNKKDMANLSSRDICEFLSQQSVQGFQSNPAVKSILEELNSGQRKAVSKALCAHHYALILGMPGTGKTTTIACLVRVLVASGKTVLLTSYTHTAVDNILLKLKEANLDFLRLGQVHKILPELQAYSVHKAAEDIKTVDQLRQFYESKSVVATTCLGMNHALFSQRFFDYCIVDEASQITQPVCIGPLRHARVFILVGDHYQLPPLVQSIEAREGGMDVSLFKRLSERHPQAVVGLEHQYRMNDDIMELSNTLIYERRLKCGTEGVAGARLELPNWDELVTRVNKSTAGGTDNWLLDALAPRRSVVFLDTDDVPSPETRSEALVCNETEAWLVQQLTCALVWGGLHPSLLGIISPYRHQLKLISQILNREPHSRFSEIEINTVDKYQGRDKSCIIVSLVRNNEHCNVGDLLRDWRRVNVAMTRAKHKLILIGSLTTLKGSLLLQELFDLLERREWVQALPFGAHHRNPCFTQLAQVSPAGIVRTQKTRFKN